MNTQKDIVNDADTSSLRGLLAFIDKETAASRELDLQWMKEQSLANLRKKRRYIHFLAGSVDMALPIDSVLETGYLPEIVPLPYLPAWLLGVVQIRGEIVSVVDLAVLYALSPPQQSHRGQRSYLLFRHGDVQFCIVADQIRGAVGIEEHSGKVKKYQRQAGDKLDNISSLFSDVAELGERKIYILDHQKLGTASQIRKWQKY